MLRPALAALLYAGVLSAQAPALSVSTTVREDLFAGFLTNDMAAFERGVATLDRLEKEHQDKPSVLAWQGAALLYRAALAQQAGKTEEFRAHYGSAIAKCEEAGFRDTRHVAVLIVCGAAHMLFLDRFPEPERSRSAELGYSGYSRTREVQAAFYQKLPLHLKGELLIGLAQLAQRKGDTDAMRRYLQEVVAGMSGTVYATRAQRWIDRPEIAAKTTVACLTCHEPGRLKNVQAARAGSTQP